MFIIKNYAKKERCFVYLLFIFVGVLLSFHLNTVYSQTEGHSQMVEGFDVIYTYDISDEKVEDGDIVSRSSDTDTYILSRKPGDKNMFGVVSKNPIFIFDREKGGMPVAIHGKVKVNTFLKEGQKIEKGDLITSSSILGKAKKVIREDEYVLGIAMTSLSPKLANGTVELNGKEFPMGKVLVDLHPGASKSEAKTIAMNVSNGGGWGRFSEATITNIIQYIVAAFVAIGSIYISFRNFTPNLEKGVISMGRNPRAKSSIRSMVIFNAFLMIVIALGGLAIAIGIIFLPI